MGQVGVVGEVGVVVMVDGSSGGGGEVGVVVMVFGSSGGGSDGRSRGCVGNSSRGHVCMCV